MTATMKFLLVQPMGSQPQFVSVYEDQIPDIVEQFAHDDVLILTDVKTQSVTHFNMGNIAFMTIQEHRDN